MPDSQIGKYRILERIARGGMGTIYGALDPVLDRKVALKVMSTEIDITDELRGRFFREAQACARLSHPNIVTVYDMGEDNGRLFIVMELLDGEEMRQIIAEKRPMPLEEKLSIMRQVCEGLHYAHQRGVVHRDIKPGNIMRLRNGQVKILDFGIAQLANAVDSLTRTGLIMGTLRYVAPEQVQGRADHRSDIYSVGAVFYELLSLRPPFDGDTAMRLLEQIRVEDPQPLEQIDPTIPPDLAALVARAMRKGPDERFTDLGQLRLGIELVQRTLAEEGRRISDRLRIQRDRLERLDTTLAERVGSERQPVPAESAEPRHLAALNALESELAARIETAEEMLRRADALAPAVERAQGLFRDGDFTGAIADLEAIVAEMPEHARAVRTLSDARRAHAEEEQLRERDTKAALEQARACRQAALMAGAPQRASDAWKTAETRLADGQAAVNERSFERAGGIVEEAATLFRQAEEHAKVVRQRQREQADAARELATKARQDAAEVHADRHSPALWKVALSRWAAGEVTLGKEEYDQAAESFARASLLFGEAAKEALEEQHERHEATVATSTSTVAAEPPKSPVVGQEQPHLAGAVPAVTDSSTRANTNSRDVTGTIVAIPRSNAAVVEPSAEASRGFGQLLKDDAPSGEGKGRALRVGGIAVGLAAVALIVLAILWISRDASTPSRKPQVVQAPQASQASQAAPAARTPQITESGPSSQTPQTKQVTGERTDQPKPADEEPSQSLPARPALGAVASTSDSSPDRRPSPPPRSEKQAIDGVAGQVRRAAEQSSTATAAARKSAERAAAAFYASKQLAAAEAKEKEGVEALARSDFPAAVRLLTEAKSDYHAAEQEARREADAERHVAPLKASVEQSRATTVTRRGQALAADAERLATALLDAAEAKHAEADRLVRTQSFAAAVRAYDEASERYLEATQRAQAAAGTK